MRISDWSSDVCSSDLQVLAAESGIAKSVDPLGGSHLVEYLTDRTEEAIEAVMREIDDYGGVIKAIEDGWLQARLAQRALERKIAIDARETHVAVGRWSGRERGWRYG